MHPSAQRPVRAALTIMVVAMVAGALYQSTGTLLFSLIGLLVCLVTLAPFFMRTAYRLDDRCVVLKRAFRTRTLEWSRIRTVTAGRTAVFVSPESSRSIRESRGLLLLCPQNRNQVIAFVRRHVGKDVIHG